MKALDIAYEVERQPHSVVRSDSTHRTNGIGRAVDRTADVVERACHRLDTLVDPLRHAHVAASTRATSDFRATCRSDARSCAGDRTARLRAADRSSISHSVASGALLACLVVAPALAATTQDLPATTAATAPATIETRVRATESDEIADRIRGILSEIAPLRGVRVRVSAGVVTLSGTVPSAADIERAGSIASRVAGVVTVQNDLERDLTLTTTLTPALDQFEAGIRSWLRALPLIGVALAVGLLIMAAGYLLASIQRLWRRLMPNPFLAEIAASFVRLLAIVLGLVVALELLGATALIGGVLGGAGVFGLALGLAARDTAGNYVASLMLSLRQPFRANDHVVIDGHEGRVIRLTSRATVLMTLDGNHLRIPNSIVFQSVILNYTRNPERRFWFDLGIDADDDPLDAMETGLRQMNALPFLLDTPAATAVIENVGDSNVVLRFFGWIDQTQTDFLKARSLAIQATKAALEGAGFALPEPIYRLRFDQRPAPVVDESKRSAHAETQPSTRRRPVDTAESDLRPDTDIDRMVFQERADDPRDDLLDNAKPIE